MKSFYRERPPWTREKLGRIRERIDLDYLRGDSNFAAEKKLRQLFMLLDLDEAIARIPGRRP